MPKNLDQQTNLRAGIIIPETPEINDQTTKSIETTLAILGPTTALPVAEMTEEELKQLPKAIQRALSYSGSIIVDAGPGITALVDGISEEDQTFSTLDVTQALIDSGLIQPNSTIIKMGPAGAVLKDEQNHKHGAEVIETTVIKTREETARVAHLDKAAWTDNDKQLHVDPLKNPDRVLLENQFIAKKQPLSESNAIFIEIDTDNYQPQDLYALIAQAAKKAGLEHYTIRGTTKGPVRTLNAVIKELPDHDLNTIEEVKTFLVPHQSTTSSDYHFAGTKSDASSRYSDRWKEITGNPIYSPDGHIHGRSEDKKVGGHCLKLIPQAGTKIYLIIEPAPVVEVS